MASDNPFADLATSAPAAPMDDNPFAKLAKKKALPGSDPNDPMWMKALRTTDDAVRAAANAMTFGGADKLAGITSDQDQGALSAEASARSPMASLAGTIGGLAVPSGLLSKGIGKVIPYLGKPTAVATSANQALTAGTISGAEDALTKGEPISPHKALASAALGGTLGLIINPLMRYLSPKARVASSGAGLTPSDVDAASQAARQAQPYFTPSVPEAVAAGAPGKAGQIAGQYNSALRSPEGSQSAYNFDAMRMKQVTEAADRAAKAIGPQTSGFSTQEAATGAIKRQADLVGASSAPYFTGASSNFVGGAPRNANMTLAKKGLMSSPAEMEDLGSAAPNSIKVLDAVRKKLNAMSLGASKVGDENKQRLIDQTAMSLRQKMEAQSPKYSTAMDIERRGGRAVDELRAGPLGGVAKTTDIGSQANRMFNVGTPAERDAADLAMRHLGVSDPSVPPGLLSHRITDAVSRNPLSLGGAFPTEASLDVARSAGSQAFPGVEGLLRASQMIDPTKRIPFSETGGHGPVGVAWHKIRDYGKGTVADLMQDPKTIPSLGIPTPLQRGSTATATGAVAASGMPAGLLDVIPEGISAEQRRKRKGYNNAMPVDLPDL